MKGPARKERTGELLRERECDRVLRQLWLVNYWRPWTPLSTPLLRKLELKKREGVTVCRLVGHHTEQHVSHTREVDS